jgi:hypothetical protein
MGQEPAGHGEAPGLGAQHRLDIGLGDAGAGRPRLGRSREWARPRSPAPGRAPEGPWRGQGRGISRGRPRRGRPGSGGRRAGCPSGPGRPSESSPEASTRPITQGQAGSARAAWITRSLPTKPDSGGSPATKIAVAKNRAPMRPAWGTSGPGLRRSPRGPAAQGDAVRQQEEGRRRQGAVGQIVESRRDAGPLQSPKAAEQ